MGVGGTNSRSLLNQKSWVGWGLRSRSLPTGSGSEGTEGPAVSAHPQETGAVRLEPPQPGRFNTALATTQRITAVPAGLGGSATCRTRGARVAAGGPARSVELPEPTRRRQKNGRVLGTRRQPEQAVAWGEQGAGQRGLELVPALGAPRRPQPSSPRLRPRQHRPAAGGVPQGGWAGARAAGREWPHPVPFAEVRFLLPFPLSLPSSRRPAVGIVSGQKCSLKMADGNEDLRADDLPGPAYDSYESLELACPAERSGHVAVSDGRYMFVWGGYKVSGWPGLADVAGCHRGSGGRSGGRARLAAPAPPMSQFSASLFFLSVGIFSRVPGPPEAPGCCHPHALLSRRALSPAAPQPCCSRSPECSVTSERSFGEGTLGVPDN